MTFQHPSAVTVTDRQKNQLSIQNSKVSKQIHGQGETYLCWAFAISSMLRQSLKMFIATLDKSPFQRFKKLFKRSNVQKALKKLNDNSFHQLLR